MSILKDLDVPIFKAGGMPAIDLKNYVLLVGGLVKEKRSFSWKDILAMPKSRVNSRLTSVSGWSVRADWEGIRWDDFVRQISFDPEANYVRFSTIGGSYTTVVSIRDLKNPRRRGHRILDLRF